MREKDIAAATTPTPGGPKADADVSVPCVEGMPGCAATTGSDGARGTEDSSWSGTCDAGPYAGKAASLILGSAGRFSATVDTANTEGVYSVSGDTVTGRSGAVGSVAVTCQRKVGGHELHCLFSNSAGGFSAQCGGIVFRAEH